MGDPKIAVLGGSGLIGHAVSLDLLNRNLAVISIARRFTSAQKSALGAAAVEAPIVDIPRGELWRLLSDIEADTIINCIGVLQDSASGSTDETHRRLAADLTEFCARVPKTLLVHLSIPGDSNDDPTAFSRSKRAGEQIISSGAAPYVILRPGFVIAPAAYGGSALIRALAILPVRLVELTSQQRLGATDIRDIHDSIAFVIDRWRAEHTNWTATWDVIERNPTYFRDVVETFRKHIGGPAPIISIPDLLLSLGAVIGDAISWLGWSPPLRSNAIAELRRGVAGDPTGWIRDTGIEPATLHDVLRRMPVTIQEKWFARLYLLKPFALGVLVLFWWASGIIPLTVSFDSSVAILTSRGISMDAARLTVIAGSLGDLAIGCAMAVRWSCRIGLIAGLLLMGIYTVAGTIIAPDLWLAPLGEMTKIMPIGMLMLLTLATLEAR